MIDLLIHILYPYYSTKMTCNTSIAKRKIFNHLCLIIMVGYVISSVSPVVATDYTRMAQDMVAASKRDAKTQERSVKGFLKKAPSHKLKSKQNHQDFDFYLHPDSSESPEGKTCRKGHLRPVDASKLSQPLLGSDGLSSTGKSDQRSGFCRIC